MESNEVRQRSHTEHRPTVSSRPFAGRIGGNQEFTLQPGDDDFRSIVSKVPDATATFTWRESFHLNGFYDVDLWKEATIEGVGTCVQIFLAGMIAIGLGPAAGVTALGPITPAIIGSLSNILIISLFIFGAGPVSGAHFNPFITISTFCAKLSTFPRTVLYVCFQCAGSTIAGFLLRAGMGDKSVFGVIPGCYVDSTLVTPAQAWVTTSERAEISKLTSCRYVFETMTALAIIFIAFGVGLDPRQRGVFGPALSPFLVCTCQLRQNKPALTIQGRTRPGDLQLRFRRCEGWICRGM